MDAAASALGDVGPLRRRLIASDDLAPVAGLLATIFPERSDRAWRAGLDRLARRDPPRGLPRVGVLLETGTRVVGALLTICAEVEERGRSIRRCHLSSWAVEPAFASHAPLLLGPLLRQQDVTLLNYSPAPHTEAVIVAQGFRLFCRGSTLVVPILKGVGPLARTLEPEVAATLPEREMLSIHLAWGCPCFAVTERGGIAPFVFAPPRRMRGLLPASRLLYCRDLERFAVHAGALAAPLLRAGIAGVLVDTPSPIPGLRGLPVGGKQGRYWRGPHPPRAGDLSYSEFALLPD